MSFHEESQLSDVLLTICIYCYLYITIAEIWRAGVPVHSFSSSAGLRVGLQAKRTLGKNYLAHVPVKTTATPRMIRGVAAC
jgi:hypothetical protein